ncbi:hypothetical protein B0A54_12805 [Friedmanniomyces endolithicus]|uniref:Uncharacterized protein n=1 Tax=Friedmanniomyces endolithicus TaxID=329885 RepID=A0A4U0UMV6_9PEZI|nr:hypothetical protein B0A54_12805 [Friedmanniomyces endolithicus]
MSPLRARLALKAQEAFVCRRCLHGPPSTSPSFRLLRNPRATLPVPPKPLRQPIRNHSRTQSTISSAHQPSSPLAALSQTISRQAAPSTTPQPSSFPSTSTPSVAYWLLASATSVFGIVVFGGLTRLTESGLSITEWRPVTGSFPPLDPQTWEAEFARYRQSPEFKMLNSSMTVDEFKKIYWMEWTHRLWGRVVGLTFLIPTVYFVARRRVSARMAVKLVGICGLIGFQGAIGWWMVKSGLKDDLLETGSHPRVSQYRLATHLGTAFVAYLAMLWNGLEILRENRLVRDPEAGLKLLETLRHPSLRTFRRSVAGLSGLIFVTAISGALVAGLDAGLVYNNFPSMGQNILPPKREMLDPFYSHTPDHSDLVWRNMFENPVLAQLDHRVLATTTFTAVLALWAYSRYSPAVQKLLPRSGKMGMLGLVHLVSLQVVLGISTLWFFVPTPLAAAHQAGALALLSGVVVLGGRVWVPQRTVRLVRHAVEQAQGKSGNLVARRGPDAMMRAKIARPVSLGELGGKPVVLVAPRDMGTTNMRDLARGLRVSFSNILYALVVGITGGAPFTYEGKATAVSDRHLGDVGGAGGASFTYNGEAWKESDIHLGDVIISTHVVEYDFGKEYDNGFQSRTEVDNVLPRAPQEVTNFIHQFERGRSAAFKRILGKTNADLAEYIELETGPGAYHEHPGSAGGVDHSGHRRDLLIKQKRVIGFEMEGAGAWEVLPTIVIKGVVDYADSHKNKKWRGYPAARAALCAAAIIEEIELPDRPHAAVTEPTPSNRVEASSTAKLPWLLPRPANPQYTGYSHVLEYLKSRIISEADESCNQRQIIAVLSGMGGVGKSETILQFVERNRTLLRERLYAALRLYDWTFGDDNVLDGVRDRLASSTTPILLILDNCDDSTVDYNRYIPNGDQDAGKKLFLRLDGLDPDAAVNLLMEPSETQDRDHDSFADAGRIVKALDFHPLAITVAGSLIQSAVYSLKEYANALDSRLAQAELLDTESEQARYKKVSATFKVSAEALAQLGSTDTSALDALALLDILAFMHHQDVHEEVFVRAWSYEDVILLSWGEEDELDEEAELDIRYLSPWHVAQCRRFLHSRPLDERMHAFRKARAHLDRLSLVNVDPATKSVSLHSLVYAWARARLQRPGEAWASAASILALSTEGRKDRQPFSDRLVRHLETSFQFASGLRDGAIFPPQRELCRIWYRFAWQMYRTSSTETIALCEQLVERTKDCCGKSCTEVGLVDAQYILGIAYLKNGQVKEAVEQLEHVVQIRESLAEDDPDRLASQHALATAYYRNEQIAQAIELLVHVVKVQQKRLAVNDPDRLSSQHELARAYLDADNGHSAQAVELLEHVVRVRKKILLEDHPSRLASQHELARAYLDDGQLGLATELLEHVVRVQEKSLLEDHANRLASQHVLARVYWADGQGQRALDLIQHVVAVWQTKQSKLQVDHPLQIQSERFLANMLEKLAVSDEALDPVDSSSADHDPGEQA